VYEFDSLIANNHRIIANFSLNFHFDGKGLQMMTFEEKHAR